MLVLCGSSISNYYNKVKLALLEKGIDFSEEYVGTGGSDEALLTHLRKERSPDAIRLANWVEREIVFPARRERERLGIRADAADFRASD